VVEHGQDSVVKLGQVPFYLLLRRLRLQPELLRQEHGPDALGDRAHSLIEVSEQSVALGLVRPHIHPIRVERGLVPVAEVHHLDEGRAVDRVRAVLEDGHVHAWVRSDELLCLVLALEHVNLDVLKLDLTDQAVELEGAAVSVEREANYVDLVLLDTFDVPWSSVNLLLAQVCSHF